MDKKAKKRIELLRKKINDVQQRLAGARKQMDDPDEVRQLEKELAAAKDEIEKLKALNEAPISERLVLHVELRRP